MIIGLVFLLSSCEKEIIPNASFENAKVFPTSFPNYSTGEKIIFNNTSLSGVVYEWDFGDGNVSNEPMPTHTYYTAGAYDVTLTVESETGHKSTFIREITIFERVIKKINIEFHWGGGNALYTMNEVGWKEEEISNFVFVIGIGEVYSIDGKIDEVVYVSDTLKNIHFENPTVTIFPKEKISLDLDLIENKEYSKTYKLQLYAVDGDQTQLYFANNGLSFWHYDENEQFILGSVGSTIAIVCDYESGI